ncbi:MAG TPA: elongation factor G [Planctomycetota bacterium]|nr:elongation factor G [Planctomycetota bacterium]
MAKYTTADIRNIALVGHGDSGKTTLAEAMLFAAKATTRLGSVDDGSSHSDWDDQEKERQSSIYTACLHLDWNSRTVNLLDTPGYPDFVGQALSSLRAVETAAVVIAASAGIGVNTRKMWEAAGKEGLARFIVVTRIDGDNVDFEALLATVAETFGRQCIPMTLPVGQGQDFKGIVSVLNPPGEIPADVIGDPSALHETLVEKALDADEALMERYLETETIGDDDLNRVLGLAIAQGEVVPILVLNAKTGEGAVEVLDVLTRFAPSPVEGVKRRLAAEEGEGEAIVPDENGPFIAQVFKIMSDPFIGKLSYFRVFSGKISTDAQLVVARTEASNKIAQLFRMQGKEQEAVDGGIPGDILAVPKVEDIVVSDTLLTTKDDQQVTPIPFPIPMVALAVEPKSRGDEQKISEGLSRLAEEDPTCSVSRDMQTKELVINGMSKLHLDVAIARLKARGVEVTSKRPKIPYRETVTKRVSEVEYTHKKQTGGAGQYAKVVVNLYPTERGAGYEFVDKIFGGVIDQSFRPSVDKGIQAKMAEGVVAGYPVVDVTVELIDGKTHPVDSKDIAFQIAGREVFKKAVMQAAPVLLEPIVNMEVTVPTRNMGDITGDVNSRRGRILGMDQQGNFQTVRAQVPLAEVTNYDAELRSITGGEGAYTLEFSHYDVVPSNITQKIIDAARRTDEEE